MSAKKYYGFFDDDNAIITWLSGYYTGNTLKYVTELYYDQSVWQLLRIFTFDYNFHGDFECKSKYGGFVIPNEEIIWHLCALSDAIKNSSTLVYNYYSDKFVKPFYYQPLEYTSNGQGKLFYSLLATTLYCVERGFTSLVEGGGGVGEGGENHLSTYRVLDDIGVKFKYCLIDPLHKSFTEKVSGQEIIHKNGYICRESIFYEPVFCDIYDNANWVDIQDNLKGPLVVKKYFYGGNKVDCMRQPYHQECRGLEHNSQMLDVLRQYNYPREEFDNCGNCCLWNALILRFCIPPTSIVRELVQLGVGMCRPIPGVTFIKHALERSTQKSFEVGEKFDLLPEVFPRQGSVSLGVKRVLTTWEGKIIRFIRERNLICHEIGGEYQIHGHYPKLFSVDGIPLYREGKIDSTPGLTFIVECYLERDQEVIQAINSRGFVILDEFDDAEGKIFMLSSPTPEKREVQVTKVKSGWTLPGSLYGLCKRHNDGSNVVKCRGSTCDRDYSYFAWVYRKRYLICEIGDPGIPYTAFLKGINNNSYPFSSVVETVNKLLDVYLNRINKKFNVSQFTGEKFQELFNVLKGWEFDIDPSLRAYKLVTPESIVRVDLANDRIRLDKRDQTLSPDKEMFVRKKRKRKGGTRRAGK
jgi:hypothetical protein